MQLIDDLDLFAKFLSSVKTPTRNRPLMPIEVAQLITRMKNEGMPIQEISQRVSITIDTIHQFLSLHKLPKEYQNVIIWGLSTDDGVSFSSAVKIARLKEIADMRILLGSAMENKFTKTEIDNIVALQRSSKIKKPMEYYIQKIKDVIVKHEYKYMYVIVLSPDTITRLQTLSQSNHVKISVYLKNIISKYLKRENILAIVVKEPKMILSLNEIGAKEFSRLLNSRKLTLGNSIKYFLNDDN